MGIEMGRVSGPLLSENLLRNGEDLAFETNLLYLNVNTGTIGIKTDLPTSTLTINGTIKSNNLAVNTQADIANLSIYINKIQNVISSITISPNQSTDPTVTATEFQTANLSFTSQSISNLITNDNINITANGTGTVKFTTPSVNVSGWMHATGNITWDGNITLGNDNTDNVTFNADITSSIIPLTNNAYDLGSLSKYWRSLYSVNVNATSITDATLITANNINLLLTPGHTVYVSTAGNDTFSGRHAHATYLTIKTALANAVSGDEIVIFPGTYTEIFPLTVPQGVSVRGTSIRSVIIKPTTATKSNDAFLLNGDTAVSFLTIQDFFYDSTNNTGYAFRFATGFKSLLKSPYIQNITVITKGSVTSGSDPIGFNQGDSGAGVLVDGNVADSTGTMIPTMLFYATTFITPNQDGITAKNGVRVEWLNSFTYYAKRGIYLINGTGGFANLGVKYGAEFRSVNSATVYGTYGAVADGSSTKGYLSGHNFGYIGAGGSSKNDVSAVVQSHEVVASNGAVLYYDSMDQKGDFRVGNIFYVNQQTGVVTFNAQSLNFTSKGSVVFESIYGITSVDAYGLQTGNIKIHDNNIDSLTGPVNFLASSTVTRLNTNVFVTGLLNVTGNTNIKGNLILGNEVTDTINIVPLITQTIKPNATNTYTLGTSSIRWNNALVKLINVDGILQLATNTISTLSTNTDLKFIASGTGKIQISTTDMQVNNNLTAIGTTTINGTTSLKNTQITGLLTLVGDINQTGSIGLTGTLTNYSNISITGSSSYLQSYGVQILNNQISSITYGTDLTLTANGTGSVILDNNLKITDNIISNNWTSASTDLQKSILFSPNGTGNVVINTTKFLTIPYDDNTSRILAAVGEIRQNSTSTLYEGYLSSGIAARFNNLYNNDLNTYITAELTVGNNDNTLRFGINGSVAATIDSSKLFTNLIEVGNIHLSGNTINNYVTDDNLIFSQNGTGSIIVNGFALKPNTIQWATDQQLTMQGTDAGYFKFSGTNGVVVPVGTSFQRRNNPVIGETRYNTTNSLLEVFNGTIWDSAIGSSSFATPDQVDDIMNTWSIILG
jgi:hypothetical protein